MAQLLLCRPALGDVAARRVDQGLLPRDRASAPEQPAIAAILAAKAVLDHERLVVLARQPRDLGLRLGDVVRVHELEERARAQLLLAPAQRPLPGGVDPLEVSVEAGRAQQVGREPPEAVVLDREAAQAVRQRPDDPAEHDEGDAPAQVVERAGRGVAARRLPDAEQEQRQGRGGQTPRPPALDGDERDRDGVQQDDEAARVLMDELQGEEGREQRRRGPEPHAVPRALRGRVARAHVRPAPSSR